MKTRLPQAWQLRGARQLETSMTTYKDHPLAFLAGRVSSEGLRERAASWREKNLSVEGLDVPATFDRAARLVDTMKAGLAEVADLIEAGADSSVIGSAILKLSVPDASVTDGIWDVGQSLRNGSRDPHGGSTASHLEMAADELRHLGRETERLLMMPEGDADEMREIAFSAIGRHVVEPNHEGTVLRM